MPSTSVRVLVHVGARAEDVKSPRHHNESMLHASRQSSEETVVRMGTQVAASAVQAIRDSGSEEPRAALPKYLRSQVRSLVFDIGRKSGKVKNGEGPLGDFADFKALNQRTMSHTI